MVLQEFCGVGGRGLGLDEGEVCVPLFCEDVLDFLANEGGHAVFVLGLG